MVDMERRREAPETLHDLFDEHGIRFPEFPVPGRQHGGARSKIWCPRCHGGREKERNFFVLVDIDGQGATWHCFRANHCGFSGGGRLRGAPRDHIARMPRQFRKPAVPEDPQRPDSLINWFAKSGISRQTVEALGVFRTARHMPVIDADGRQVPNKTAPRSVIAYPYVDDGELVNVKYKTIYPGGEKRFQQEAGTRRSLFNIDSFDKFGPDDFGVIVEGEDDVLACWEAGWRQVTTLPDGSPSKLGDWKGPGADDDQRYVALHGEPRLDQLKVIVLAGDMDEAGFRHHEELARRLGKQRCKVAKWPDGCKDAKDTLRLRGVEAVNHAIETAIWYPLEGVIPLPDDAAETAWHGERSTRIETGMWLIDQRLALARGGQFIVTTGISGRGKTSLWTALASLYAEHSEEIEKTDPGERPFHTVIASAEMNVMVMATRLIAHRARKPFHPHQVVPRVGLREMLEETLPWVRRHFTFIRWHDRATQPTLTWLLERMEENIQRTGAKLAIIDPWQEFDDEMPDRFPNHSRWVGRRIQQVIGLGDRQRCNMVAITHPTKLKRGKDGKTEIPDGNDIADSAHFFSRCDIGLTVHRPSDTADEMLIRVWKSRDPGFSRYGDTELRYDPLTFRVHPRPSVLNPQGEERPQWTGHWSDTDKI